MADLAFAIFIGVGLWACGFIMGLWCAMPTLRRANRNTDRALTLLQKSQENAAFWERRVSQETLQ